MNTTKLYKQMIRIGTLTLLFISMSISSYGQSDMFDKSLQVLENYNNIAYDYISSFLYHPYNHANTEKVYGGLRTMEKGYEDLLKGKYKVLSTINHRKAYEYYENVEKMLALLKAFNDYIGTISGYIRPGVDAPEFEILLKPIFENFGWKCRQLTVQCDNLNLYEYSYGQFKMLLARNTLPAPNYELRTHNDIRFYCYAYFPQTKKTDVYVTGIIRGGKYRLISYKDDSNRSYYPIRKCVAKREVNTGVLDERLIMWVTPK